MGVEGEGLEIRVWESFDGCGGEIMEMNGKC